MAVLGVLSFTLEVPDLEPVFASMPTRGSWRIFRARSPVFAARIRNGLQSFSSRARIANGCTTSHYAPKTFRP